MPGTSSFTGNNAATAAAHGALGFFCFMWGLQSILRSRKTLILANFIHIKILVVRGLVFFVF